MDTLPAALKCRKKKKSQSQIYIVGYIIYSSDIIEPISSELAAKYSIPTYYIGAIKIR